MVVFDSIFKRTRNGGLSHNCIKGLWTIFSSRNNKIAHQNKVNSIKLFFSKGSKKDTNKLTIYSVFQLLQKSVGFLKKVK
jgi:hypothetical protein